MCFNPFDMTPGAFFGTIIILAICFGGIVEIIKAWKGREDE